MEKSKLEQQSIEILKTLDTVYVETGNFHDLLQRVDDVIANVSEVESKALTDVFAEINECEKRLKELNAYVDGLHPQLMQEVEPFLSRLSHRLKIRKTHTHHLQPDVNAIIFIRNSDK